MPKKSLEFRVAQSETEIGKALDSFLEAQGFSRTGAQKNYLWKKGVLWTIFAKFKFIDGLVHLDVWNHIPLPGMGSFLVFFMNTGKLDEFLHGMKKAALGGIAGKEVVAEETEKSCQVRYAGFWRRLAACCIDLLILYALFGVISLIGFGAARSSGREIFMLVVNIMSLLFLVGSWLYFSFFESSTSQASPGKKVLRIIVTDADGRRMTFGKASGRFWAKLLSSLVFGIGFLMAAFSGKKQALHDLIAGTLVVRR